MEIAHLQRQVGKLRSCGAGKIGNSGVSDYEVINLYIAL